MAIALMFARYGEPEVLEPIEIDEEPLSPGQIRVRVRAAGVQPFDCALRRGDFSRVIPLVLPSRLGNEFAGVVEAVGAGVSGVTAGSEVLGFEPMACYAETVVVNADQVVAKPSGMPWEAAGVLSASGQTAATAMQDLGIGAHDTVLIHAAAGGVGSFAVQLARARGATVIGTASERNHAYLRELGATPVRYGDGLVDRVRGLAPSGVDAVLDAIGGEALDISLELVEQRERIGTTADFAGAARRGVRLIRTRRSSQQLADLASLYEQDRLRVSIWRSFQLRDAARAQREVETGHVRGKVVLTVD